jgi:hypothetical protein
MIFWLVLKLEISYIDYNILKDFGFFWRIFWRLYFFLMKYSSFHNSSFALKYFLMQTARPQCDTLLRRVLKVRTINHFLHLTKAWPWVKLHLNWYLHLLERRFLKATFVLGNVIYFDSKTIFIYFSYLFIYLSCFEDAKKLTFIFKSLFNSSSCLHFAYLVIHSPVISFLLSLLNLNLFFWQDWPCSDLFAG